MNNGFVLDIESDGFVFESTKIWSLCIQDLDDPSSREKINPFKDSDAKTKFIAWLDRYETPKVVFHNGLGFDIFVLMNLLGINFSVGPDIIEGRKVQFVDTFYLSMFLNPDREGHGVGYFGEILGLEKIDWRQEAISLGLIHQNSPDGAEFKQYHPKMDEYCERDVEVNALIFNYLKKEWKEMYGTSFEVTDAYKCGQKAFYLMSCQELTGWKFDVDAANALVLRIQEMMEEIRAEVEPQLPPRALKKGEMKEYTMPAKPYKKDGSLSSIMEKWIEKHNGSLLENGKYSFYGKEYEIVGGQLLDITLPMEMANQDQMKEYFLQIGWKPTLFNFQRGTDGKPLRDPRTRQLIPTSPKIQEAGKICPNLMKMEGELVQKVVKWLSLRNRLSVLQGWLSNPRLAMDGRLGAGRTGIASTHRQKHKVVVNVPKASDNVLLGKEFRSLWIADEGMLIAAGDAAALEGRVMAHYSYKYDGGLTADEILNGDPHSKNAMAFFGHMDDLQGVDIQCPNFNKDDPKFKPYRDRSKNGFYALN